MLNYEKNWSFIHTEGFSVKKQSVIIISLYWNRDSVNEVSVLLEHDGASVGNPCWRY
jgi:hypothetical protein